MNNYDDQQRETALENEGLEQMCEETAQKEVAPAEWHSVVYPASVGLAEQPKKRTNKRRLASAALALMCALAIALVAGVGGAFFARQLLLSADSDKGGALLGAGDVVFEDDNGHANNGGVQGSGTANGTGGSGAEIGDGTPYPADTEPYDYAAAFAALQKNNDASLIGSLNGSAGDASMSLIQATARVKDSVVEIINETNSYRGTMYAGVGSGVIIHEDGLIVTNHHVIENLDQIVVRLTNGERYYATLRGSDEKGDIAIIKIKPREESPLTVAKLGYSASLVLGEEVIAIGNPLGELGGTITNGIISATKRKITVDGTVMTLLQTNAAINGGNSGGGLFNMAGELIGIVNAKYSASGVEGLGFAIPIDTAYAESFGDLLQYGYMRGVPDLGVKLEEHTGGTFFLVYGAYVANANGHGAIQTGDYIYSIDGTVVYSISTSAVDAIKTILLTHEVGDTVTVVVKRGNANVTLEVTLQEYVPA